MNSFSHIHRDAVPFKEGAVTIDTGKLVFSVCVERADWVGDKDFKTDSYKQFFSLGAAVSGNGAVKLESQMLLQKLLTTLGKHDVLRPLLRHRFDVDDNDDYFVAVETDVGFPTKGGAIAIEDTKPLLRKALIVCINGGFITQSQAVSLYTFIDNVGARVTAQPNDVPNLAEARGRIRGIAHIMPPDNRYQTIINRVRYAFGRNIAK